MAFKFKSGVTGGIRTIIGDKRYRGRCGTISKFFLENDPASITKYRVVDYDQTKYYLMERAELRDHIAKGDLIYIPATGGSPIINEFGTKFSKGYSSYFKVKEPKSRI